MTYIVLDKNKIVANYFADNETDIVTSLINEGISVYTEIKLVSKSNDFLDFKYGQDVNEFDSTFKLKSVSDRVKSGLIVLKTDEKIENNTIVKKSLQEQFNEGIFLPKIGFKVVDNQVVPMTDKEKLVVKLVTLEEYKNSLFDQCSIIATSNIYKTYPQYKQQNLTNDFNYYSNVLSVEYTQLASKLAKPEIAKSVEQILLEMNTLVLAQKTIDALLTFRSSIPTYDLSAYTKNSLAKDKARHTEYYRTILESIVSYRLIKYVRDWCNAKQALIYATTNKEELEAISTEDCPIL